MTTRRDMLKLAAAAPIAAMAPYLAFKSHSRELLLVQDPLVDLSQNRGLSAFSNDRRLITATDLAEFVETIELNLRTGSAGLAALSSAASYPILNSLLREYALRQSIDYPVDTDVRYLEWRPTIKSGDSA